jgi:vacuolar-type H+-ATPase subunit H
MGDVEEVLKIVRSVEEELQKLEGRISAVRAQLERAVEETVAEMSRELDRLVEEERIKALSGAEARAKEEAERIRGEYLRRAEAVRSRLAEERQGLIKFVVNQLLQAGV